MKWANISVHFCEELLASQGYYWLTVITLRFYKASILEVYATGTCFSLALILNVPNYEIHAVCIMWLTLSFKWAFASKIYIVWRLFPIWLNISYYLQEAHECWTSHEGRLAIGKLNKAINVKGMSDIFLLMSVELLTPLLVLLGLILLWSIILLFYSRGIRWLDLQIRRRIIIYD